MSRFLLGVDKKAGQNGMIRGLVGLLTNLKKMIKNFFTWLVASSADPNKVSLTVTSALTALIPYGIFLSGITHHSLDAADAGAVVAAIGTLVQVLLTAVSVCLFLYGLIRKIYLSLTGRNAAMLG